MTPDAALLHWIQTHRWMPLAPVVRVYTRYTSEIAVIEWATLGAMIFALRQRWASAGYLFLGTAIGVGLVDTIKSVVARPRPPGAHMHSMSFPSGHAMGSTILFSLIAWLASQENPSQGKGWAILATVLTLFSGYCRLYLAVHWPTDVLGGFVLGALFAYGWTRAFKALAEKHL